MEPEEWGPKGRAPQRGARRVGARRRGAQNFALFFLRRGFTRQPENSKRAHVKGPGASNTTKQRHCMDCLSSELRSVPNLLGSPLLHSFTRDQQLLVDSLFLELRCIPNLLGRRLSHSFTRDQRHRLTASSVSRSCRPSHQDIRRRLPPRPRQLWLALFLGWPQQHNGLQQLSPNLHGSINADFDCR